MGGSVVKVVQERDREIRPGQHVGRVLPAPTCPGTPLDLERSGSANAVPGKAMVC